MKGREQKTLGPWLRPLVLLGAGAALGFAASTIPKHNPASPGEPAPTVEYAVRADIQALASAIQRLQTDLDLITRKLDTVDRSPVPPAGVDPPDVDAAQLLARVDRLTARLEAELTRPVIPAAMDFDLAHAPDRSTTSASIEQAATAAARDRESATKDHLLLPMGVMLQRYGRPDSVTGSSHGGAQWVWKTDDGHELIAQFSWGRVLWVNGGLPSK